MSQNLVSLEVSEDTVKALDLAIGTLEAFSQSLLSLGTDERLRLARMGAKSEAFCREALVVLEQNQASLPANFDLPGFRQDMAAYDALRPLTSRLEEVMRRFEDTQTALGSDLFTASLEGYAFMKLTGKHEGLEKLRSTLSTIRGGRPKKAQPPAVAG